MPPLKLMIIAISFGAMMGCKKSPVACFTMPETAKQFDQVSCDASCSENVEGYSWYIYGSNSADANIVSGQNASVSVWSFSQPGEFTMKLEVSIGAPGAGESITKKITIYQ